VTLGCVASMTRLGIYGIPLATGLTYLVVALLQRRGAWTKKAALFYGG
jgi:hypothetical protein